jgi:hypothetical protein
MYDYVWFPRGRERGGLAVPAYFTLQSTPIMLNQQNTIHFYIVDSLLKLIFR